MVSVCYNFSENFKKLYMANLKSSKKDIRRIEKLTLLNKTYIDTMRGAVKGARLSISKKSVSAEQISAAQKALDKAAKRGVIKKQTASRIKSRLMTEAQKVSK